MIKLFYELIFFLLMKGRAPIIKIRYNDKEKECNIIKNYSEFLRTCYQYFEITKE